MEHCLVYFSTSVGLLQEDDLMNILNHSRQNNAMAGITGALLYVRGSIVQVLEGDKDVLDALYKRIERDPRHKNVTRVLSRPITERLFSDWLMGYETITARQFGELSELINLTPGPEMATDSKEHTILKMIRLFYGGSRYN